MILQKCSLAIKIYFVRGKMSWPVAFLQRKLDITAHPVCRTPFLFLLFKMLVTIQTVKVRSLVPRTGLETATRNMRHCVLSDIWKQKHTHLNSTEIISCLRIYFNSSPSFIHSHYKPCRHHRLMHAGKIKKHNRSINKNLGNETSVHTACLWNTTQGCSFGESCCKCTRRRGEDHWNSL